jgi:hypothetical protein
MIQLAADTPKIRRIRLKTQDASSASTRYNTTSLVISDKNALVMQKRKTLDAATENAEDSPTEMV